MNYLTILIIFSTISILIIELNAKNLLDTENFLHLRAKVIALEDFLWKQIEDDRDVESYTFSVQKVVKYHDQFIFNHNQFFAQNFPHNLYQQLDFYSKWMLIKNNSIAVTDIFNDFRSVLNNIRDENIEDCEEYIQNAVTDILPKVKMHDIHMEKLLESLSDGMSELYRMIKFV